MYLWYSLTHACTEPHKTQIHKQYYESQWWWWWFDDDDDDEEEEEEEEGEELEEFDGFNCCLNIDW